jgi:hypothetical protein
MFSAIILAGLSVVTVYRAVTGDIGSGGDFDPWMDDNYPF